MKRLDPTQLVMTVDAYDVILSPELLSIVDKVPDGTIIFNGEYTCWPDESAAPLIPAGGPLKYLNSGVIVGQAGKMMKMLEEVRARARRLANTSFGAILTSLFLSGADVPGAV